MYVRIDTTPPSMGDLVLCLMKVMVSSEGLYFPTVIRLEKVTSKQNRQKLEVNLP